MDTNTVRGAVRAQLLAAALTAGMLAPVVALAAGAPEEELQEVIVTGSRLEREGMSSPTPITQLTIDELQNANAQSLAQGLAELPSMSTSTVPGSTGGRTTAGPGTFLSLRGLGSTRNLILLDGMRIAPSNVYGNVDVNLLPQTLVSNVQVVTGGASAAYGSDAVAGVTNFILDTHFKGFKADISGGIADAGDGEMGKLALAWGGSFMNDRLHLISSFDWRHSEDAWVENHPWSNQHCGILSTGVTAANATPDNPMRVVTCGIQQQNSAYGGVIVSGPWVTPTGSVSFGPGGVPQAFTYGAFSTRPAAYNPANPTALRLTGLYQVGGTGGATWQGDVTNFYTPLDNKVWFGRAGFEFNDNVEGFAQLHLSRTKSTYAQTPPYFNGGNPFTIFSGNPFIPEVIQDRMTADNIPQFSLGITPKSWGNVYVDSGEKSYDATLGLKGNFAGAWRWNAHVERGRYKFHAAYNDTISMARLYRALDAVQDPATGAIVCRVMLTNPSADNNRCVPINPFGEGSASQAALDYVHGVMDQWNDVIQNSAAANISGEPFSLWAGPVSVGVGIEWRKLKGEQSSDPTAHSPIDFTGVRGFYAPLATQIGGWATNNVLEYAGSIKVTEGFFETLVPLLKEQPFAQALDFNGAVRLTDYSQSGQVTTWKVGLTWRPFDQLLVRATQSRDIRAPGISELYQPVSLGPPVGLTDTPFPNPDGSVRSIRVSTGVVGNPALKPEKAKTFTGGFTYQPVWLEGLALSADYYDIKIKDSLAGVGAQDTLDRCALGQAQFCTNIIRDPTTNLVQQIYTPTANLNQARTRGVDLEASYRRSLAGGSLGFRLIATRLIEQSSTTVRATGQSYIDNAGIVGASAPEWIATAAVDWRRGGLSLNLNARHVAAGRYNSTYTETDLEREALNIGSYTLFSTAVRYQFEQARGRPELYLQVHNLFDRDPPLVPGNPSLIGFQTLSSMYDTLGRFYTAGVRLQF